jgi:hypothetical protein
MARITSLAEAIKSAIHDGDTIALEGFTHLIPHAAGHEIIRQGRKNLTLIRMTPDLVYDQLIGMGCVTKLVFSWGGNPGVGSLHRLRDAVENGWPHKLELEEHSHAAMANAYEAGAELTPESVAKFSLEHPRCGTAFILTLVLVSILVFTALGPLSLFWRLASRVLLIPVLAGISLEYIRWTANHLDSPIVRFLIKPNLALQSLTTREPDASMLEVAIQSFKTMRQAEQELVV